MNPASGDEPLSPDGEGPYGPSGATWCHPYGSPSAYELPPDTVSGSYYAWGPEQGRIGRLGWGGPATPPPRGLARETGRGRDRPLRVVHVGPCLTRGGAEQWLVELTRFLDPDRVRIVRAIATTPGSIDPTFAAGLTVPHENGGAASVRRALEQADVLLGWGVPMDEILDGHRPGLCVFVAHGDGQYTRELVDRSVGHVDHFVAVSERTRELTCLDRPTTVIRNGVDAARLARSRPRDEVRDQFGFGPDDFVLGYVGRFSIEKRVHLLIEAVARMPGNVKLLLVGWGVRLEELRRLADQKLPGRYTIVTAGAYLGDYYGAMDAFGLVSNQEGCSLAMIEAMMCGVPLIVTPVGAVPELIVDRVNGQVVAPRPEAIAAAVHRLQSFPHWAHGMAAEAKTHADRHGHAIRMARDYEQLIETLWTKKHGQSPDHTETPATARYAVKISASS